MSRGSLPWLFSKRKGEGIPWRTDGPPPQDESRPRPRRERKEGDRRWI